MGGPLGLGPKRAEAVDPPLETNRKIQCLAGAVRDANVREGFDFSPKRCKVVHMRRTVDLDPDLETELSEVVSLTKEKPAVVIRQALRAGLPTVANRFQAPRPAGYFAEDYGPDRERVALEKSMRMVVQKPER